MDNKWEVCGHLSDPNSLSFVRCKQSSDEEKEQKCTEPRLKY